MQKEILFTEMKSPKGVEEFRRGITEDEFDAFLVDFNAARKRQEDVLASRFFLKPGQRIFSPSLRIRFYIIDKHVMKGRSQEVKELRALIRRNREDDSDFCKQWNSAKVTTIKKMIE